MKNLVSQRRRAFTLVEILVVISIIIVLVALTLGILGPVRNAINSAQAKTQINKIQLALGQFKTTYGEYPMLQGNGGSTEWQKLLLDALRGDKILVRKNAQIQLVNYNEGRSRAERRPFLALADFALDSDSVDSATTILDPWENPYQYRYNNISGGKPDRSWKNPGFLLISAGAEFNDPVSDDDYFNGNMEIEGRPDLDPNSGNYYFDGIRADNITNFAE